VKTKKIKVFENEVEADLFLPEGKVLGIVAERKKICLTRYNGEIFAMPDKCPHQDFPLSKGSCSTEGEIICPYHKYSFSLLDGRQTKAKGYFLKMLAVETSTEGVFVNWPITIIDFLLD
jgi:3-phenylpropionate/trans-cinnamate dioxygenase ferredoxin subunit